MRSNWRIWFTWVFAVLFGVLSTAGEGLHLLPGQGHGHDACCHDHDDGCNDDGCDDANCVSDSADRSPAAPDNAKELAARSPAAVEVHGQPSIASRSTLHLCDDDCAICKFSVRPFGTRQARPFSTGSSCCSSTGRRREIGRRLPLGSSPFLSRARLHSPRRARPNRPLGFAVATGVVLPCMPFRRLGDAIARRRVLRDRIVNQSS